MQNQKERPMNDVSRGLANRIGAERHELHKDHQSSRPLSEGYEGVSLEGEFTFALNYGVPVDLKARAGGDGGIDFVIALKYTVDVKTARKAFNLIVEEGKVKADIFVLASFCDDTGEASLIGWAWRTEVLKAPVKDFGHGIMNHYIPLGSLHPMAALESRLARIGLCHLLTTFAESY
jgi:hypothetical protein